MDYRYDEGVAFLTITGDLDLLTVPQLEEMAYRASLDLAGTIRIDLSGVSFIDSTGISALVLMKSNAEHRRNVLILDAPSERVHRLLELTGLTEHFQIE
jgi:anti-sigma B factor antagonist